MPTVAGDDSSVSLLACAPRLFSASSSSKNTPTNIVFLIDPCRSVQLPLIRSVMTKLLVYFQTYVDEDTRWTFHLIGSRQRPCSLMLVGKQNIQQALDVVRNALSASRAPATAPAICDALIRLWADIDWECDSLASNQGSSPLGSTALAVTARGLNHIYIMTAFPDDVAGVQHLLQTHEHIIDEDIAVHLAACFSRYDTLNVLKRGRISLNFIECTEVSHTDTKQAIMSASEDLIRTVGSGILASAHYLLATAQLFGLSALGIILGSCESLTKNVISVLPIAKTMCFIIDGSEHTIRIEPFSQNVQSDIPYRWKFESCIPQLALWNSDLESITDILVDAVSLHAALKSTSLVFPPSVTVCYKLQTISKDVEALLFPLTANVALLKVLACCLLIYSPLRVIEQQNNRHFMNFSDVERWTESKNLILTTHSASMETFDVSIELIRPISPQRRTPTKTVQRTPRSTRKQEPTLIAGNAEQMLERCTTVQLVYDWLDDVVCDIVYCDKVSIQEFTNKLLPLVKNKLRDLHENNISGLDGFLTLLREEYLLPLDKFTIKHRDVIAKTLSSSTQMIDASSCLKQSEREVILSLRDRILDPDVQAKWLVAVKLRDCQLQIVLLLDVCLLHDVLSIPLPITRVTHSNESSRPLLPSQRIKRNRIDSAVIVSESEEEQESDYIKQLDFYVGRLSIWCSIGDAMLDTDTSLGKRNSLISMNSHTGANHEDDDDIKLRQWVESVVIPTYHPDLPDQVERIYRSCGGDIAKYLQTTVNPYSPLRFRIAPKRTKKLSDRIDGLPIPMARTGAALTRQLYGRSRMEVALPRPKVSRKGVKSVFRRNPDKVKQSVQTIEQPCTSTIANLPALMSPNILHIHQNFADRDSKRRRQSTNRCLFPIVEGTPSIKHDSQALASLPMSLMQRTELPISPTAHRQSFSISNVVTNSKLTTDNSDGNSILTPTPYTGRKILSEALRFAGRLGGHPPQQSEEHIEKGHAQSRTDMNPFSGPSTASTHDTVQAMFATSSVPKIILRSRPKPSVRSMMRRYQGYKQITSNIDDFSTTSIHEYQVSIDVPPLIGIQNTDLPLTPTFKAGTEQHNKKTPNSVQLSVRKANLSMNTIFSPFADIKDILYSITADF